MKNLLLTLFLFFSLTLHAQTSLFTKNFSLLNGDPLTGFSNYIYLVPQANTYPTGALALTEDGTRPGVYHRINVPDGEYKIYIDLDKGGANAPILYLQNYWLGEKRLSTIANHFDADDSYKLKSTGIKNGAILTVLLNDGAVTTDKIENAGVTLPKLSQTVIDFINSAGGGTITNLPDDVTLEAKGTDPETIGIKESYINGLFKDSALVIDIRSYGAIGNGVTDAKNAIQAAVNNGSGNTVYIPEGVFKISSGRVELENLNNMIIRGSGKGSVLDVSDNTNPAFFITNCHNVVFDNFSIKGDFDTATSNNTLQGGIVFNDGGSNSSGCTIQNMYFNNLCGDAITFLGNESGHKVIYNTWEGGLGFVQLIGTSVSSWKVSDILIQGNTILGSADSDRPPAPMCGSDDFVDMWGWIEGVKIIDNYFDARRLKTDTTSCGRGVMLGNYGEGTLKDIMVSRNTFLNFHNNHTGAYSDFPAVDMEVTPVYSDSLSDGIEISYNYIKADSSVGIRLGGVGNITVENNTIIGTKYGIYINDSDGGTKKSGITMVRGNFIKAKHRGIEITKYFVNVENNVFDISDIVLGGGGGVYYSTGDSSIIKNNMFVSKYKKYSVNNYEYYGIMFVNGDGVSIYNNIFKNLNIGVNFYDAVSKSAIRFANNSFVNNTLNTFGMDASLYNSFAEINNNYGVNTSNYVLDPITGEYENKRFNDVHIYGQADIDGSSTITRNFNVKGSVIKLDSLSIPADTSVVSAGNLYIDATGIVKRKFYVYGAELLTGTDSNMSGANNWASPTSGTFDVNTTVAGKMYILGGGTNDYIYLSPGISAGATYRVSLKARLNAGISTTIRFRFGTQYFEFTPTATETTFVGFVESDGTTIFLGLTSPATFDGVAFEFDDVSIIELLNP